MRRRPIRASITAFALVGILAGLVPTSTLAATGSNPAAADAGVVLAASSSTTPGSDAGRGPVAKARLALGGHHACLLATDGTVRCWGRNTDGQLGDAEFAAIGLGPAQVIGVIDAVAIAAGEAHSCAILGNGSVKCWGSNALGQIGNDGGSRSALPVTVPDVSGAIAIAAGSNHTCAVLVGGTAKCWGAHDFAQLGNGSAPSSFYSTALSVSGLTGAVGITAGQRHTCARLADGTARCWGDDSSGQLGGVVSSGTVARTPIAVTGVSGVVDIAAGAAHTCVALAGGSARCWGSNDAGQLGNGAALPAPNSPTSVAVTTLTGAVAIAAGAGNTCAQVADGGIRCWGANARGQLGVNIESPGSSTPVAPTGLGTVVAIGVGVTFVCALRGDGTAMCWGNNESGQLHGSFSSNAKVPVRVRGRLSTGTIQAGSPHTCALSSLGTVQCWGRNLQGELGINDDTVDYSATPKSVYGLSGVLDISAGNSHTCALLRTGAIKCWGANDKGQLGNTGAGAFAIAPVDVMSLGGTAIAVSAGGQHTCAVLSDLTARCWGANLNGQLGDGTNTPRTLPATVSGLATAIRISAGSSHTCAILADSTARCWGSNGSGQLGDASYSESWTPRPVLFYLEGVSSLAPQRNIVQIIARYAFSCALLSDGLVKCWGFNGYGSLGYDDGKGNKNFIPGSGTVGSATGSAINIGPASGHGAHACAVKVDGTADCWGGNGNGELGNGTTNAGATPVPNDVQGLVDAAQISVGFAHSCALLAGGTAKCWGFGGDGQLGNNSFATPKTTPQAVSGWTAGSRATAIDAGGAHTCALLGNGSVRCWGSNANGRLGDGTTTQRTKPVAVTGLASGSGISAGDGHSCALLADGLVRCWGANVYGQLGDGTLTGRPSSVLVTGLFQARAISAGGNHACALLYNGTVKCWGRNASGQLGDGTTTLRKAPVAVKASSTTTLTNVIAISAGTDHTCAVLADGTARCWGAGASGRLGNGSTTNRLYPVAVSGVTTSSSVTARFTAISAGAAHTCARTANGAAKCWGLNTSGRLGDGTITTRPTPVVVTGLTGVVSISAGGSHSCAQLSAGSAKCWGNGANGRLGTGSTATKTTPTAVTSLSGATAISAGGSHTCAILATGAPRCWGLNTNGQIGNGSTTESSTPKAVSGL